MKNLQKQNTQNVYYSRDGNSRQFEGQNQISNSYRPQDFPQNNDLGIELNDFTNPQNKRSETVPLRKEYRFCTYCIFIRFYNNEYEGKKHMAWKPNGTP